MGIRSGGIRLPQQAGYSRGPAIHRGGAIAMAGPIQSIVGVTILTMAMQAIWAVVGPIAPPIVVHDIRYENGYIVQDRTVASEGPFKAVWTAEIQSKDTGAVASGCIGTGVWDYEAGHKAPRIPIAEWVGNPACRLGPGVYIPIATYSAGEFHLVARGDEFEVK